MTNKERTDLLAEVCAIDSRTREGAEGATQVAEILGARLKPMGFDLDFITPPASEGPRGRHLRAVRNPGAPTRILLLGHTDTILSPSDTPFRLDNAAGKAYGSGVLDMKGGCAVMVDALGTALAEDKSVREACMMVLLNAAEEIGSPSYRDLVRGAAAGAKGCLCFEPCAFEPNGDQTVVVARKGITRFLLSCHGRAGHAGNDHAYGVNAIREVARKVEQIEALTDYASGVTANVGRIEGGRTFNQIADEAHVEFELRAFDPGALQRAREAAEKICAEPTVRSAADGTPTRLELQVDSSYRTWPRNARSDALGEMYVQLARARGVKVSPVSRGGGSDASHAADLAPTIDGLGLLGGGMHSTTEWADISIWEVRARVAADLITRLCAPGSSKA